jgi:hypothetical protein
LTTFLNFLPSGNPNFLTPVFPGRGHPDHRLTAWIPPPIKAEENISGEGQGQTLSSAMRLVIRNTALDKLEEKSKNISSPQKLKRNSKTRQFSWIRVHLQHACQKVESGA